MKDLRACADAISSGLEPNVPMTPSNTPSTRPQTPPSPIPTRAPSPPAAVVQPAQGLVFAPVRPAPTNLPPPAPVARQAVPPPAPVARPAIVPPPANLPQPAPEVEENVPVIDGYVLNHEQTVRMLEHVGITETPYSVQDRMVTPTSDQRVIGDRNVKQVSAPMRVITVSARQVSSLSRIPAAILSMSAAIFTIAGSFVRDFSSLNWPIPPSILSFGLYTVAVALYAAFGVGVMPKPARGSFLDNLRGWLWNSDREIHIHYIPHVLASLHKETSVLSTFDTEVTNVMMKIRRLAALPIPDRASVQLIDGTVKAYQVMLESRDFMGAALDDLLH